MSLHPLRSNPQTPYFWRIRNISASNALSLFRYGISQFVTALNSLKRVSVQMSNQTLYREVPRAKFPKQYLLFRPVMAHNAQSLTEFLQQ